MNNLSYEMERDVYYITEACGRTKSTAGNDDRNVFEYRMSVGTFIFYADMLLSVLVSLLPAVAYRLY
jgi:hypothetical protein